MFGRLFARLVLPLTLSGCGLPPLVLLEDPSLQIAPSGPSVAALLANVKCELWQAANDTTELPYYEDTIYLNERHFAENPNCTFNLKNLFTEIEYVAELKLTLEVTDSGAFNPSANFIKTLPAPMTNLTLAVGGQFYDSADRVFDLYQSVDFQRLVASPVHPLYKSGLKVGKYPPFTFTKPEPPQARGPYRIVAGDTSDPSPCDHGLGLHGRLGLREALATSAIAARMQDVAVLVSTGGSSSGTVYGQIPQLSAFNGYAFGEMDTTINFTINMDINAGPNWTLTSFKGPNVASEGGANGLGLVNFSRWAKDLLILTVIPVCIRQKYFPKQWIHLKESELQPVTSSSPSFTGTLDGNVKNGAIAASLSVVPSTSKKTLPTIKFPVEYDPPMDYGTPIWANYLPPCLSPQGQAALAAAPAAAKTNLQLQGIDNLLRQQQRPRM